MEDKAETTPHLPLSDYARPGYRAWVLAVLVTAYSFNFIDR